MKPHFLFPSDPMGARSVDPVFQDQADALKSAGFGVSRLSDGMRVIGDVPADATIVYRGWMLDEAEYLSFLDGIEQRSLIPITGSYTYMLAHWLPNWYEYVTDFTPATVVFPNGTYNTEDLPEIVESLLQQWDGIIVKDFVKSLKTGYGHIINKNPDLLPSIVGQMMHYRGKIEGGLCLRKFEEFIPDSEKRFFCLNGHAYTAKLDSNIRVMAESTYLALAAEVATRIPAKFFSVDIALTPNLTPRIVEIGDGQVSDLVGWTPEEFAGMWIGQ